jgi:hypothetical protein
MVSKEDLISMASEAYWGILLRTLGLQAIRPKTDKEAIEIVEAIWNDIHSSEKRLGDIAEKLPAIRSSLSKLRCVPEERKRANIIIGRMCQEPTRVKHGGFCNVQEELRKLLEAA